MSWTPIARLIASAVVVAWSVVAWAQPVRLDGVVGEWMPGDALASTAGGSSGIFTVSSVSARSDGTRLYLRFDTGVVTNLQAGNGGEGTLVLDIRRTQPSEQQALAVDFRSRTLYQNGNPGSTVGWDDAGIFVQPTYAASEYEMVIDVSSVGIQQGDTIKITFGNGSAGEDAAPFVLSAPGSAPAERLYDRPAATRFRISSVNTLSTGLFDNQQEDGLARLIDAMDADVYCFQEEYSSSAGQIENLLESIDPLGNGAPWHVSKNNDCVIASNDPLVPLPLLNTKYVAVGVDLGGGRRVIVYSIHPKCCGYIGSSEDTQRIDETQAMIDALDDVRAGTAGASLLPFADAPAVFVGDWNLVGSRTPLDMIEDAGGPDLHDVLPGPLVGNALYTWRGSSTGAGSFMPGRLDVLAVQRNALAVMNAFTLDTGVLDAADLSALGLQSGDSGSTDHLMLVADLAFPSDLCTGDITGNDAVNVFDFSVLAANFGAGPGATRSEGDLDGNGYVNVFDFAELAGSFGGMCP